MKVAHLYLFSKPDNTTQTNTQASLIFSSLQSNLIWINPWHIITTGWCKKALIFDVIFVVSVASLSILHAFKQYSRTHYHFTKVYKILWVAHFFGFQKSKQITFLLEGWVKYKTVSKCKQIRVLLKWPWLFLEG